MKREPRLQFSDADLAEPKLEKPIKRVKKAAAKADKAQAKIPKKTVVKKERGFDPATGKVKTQLRFEEVDKKKPPSKLTHAVQDAPANFVLSQVHREVRQSEDDNVGVEAAHKVEQAVESGGRLVQSAHRAHQLKPYRAAIRAEKKLERANLDALQKKAEIDSPTSNPVSKWQQKQAIKKQYAAAKHNQAAQTTAKAAENTTKAAKKAAEKAEKAGKYVGTPARLCHCRRNSADAGISAQRPVLLLGDNGWRRLRDRGQYLSVAGRRYAGCGSAVLRNGGRASALPRHLRKHP